MADPISIPAQGRIARFIDQFFPGLSEGFQGSALVESLGYHTGRGKIVVMALELGSEAGEFTALP